MDASVKAVIYLSDHRGCTQSDLFRRYHTFNFDSYQNEDRKSFGGVQVFNDETLKEKSTLSYPITADEAIMLVPLVGSLHYKLNACHDLLEVGQAQMLFSDNATRLDITNPYEEDLINFLQIRFKVNSLSTGKLSVKTYFDLNENTNELIPLSANCLIGKFDGRKECTYRTQRGKDVFLFILEGAFEAQNRLLEARDGLALTNVNDVEFEALSDGAIMILIEL